MAVYLVSQKSSDSKFVIRKWNIVNDQSNANYDVGNETIYNKDILKSNSCDYKDSYILVRVNITIIGHQITQVSFKSCAPFTKSVTKIDGTTIADVEDLDLVTSMHNLMKYSSNYSETTGSLWFYSKDEATGFNEDIANDNNFKYLKYQAKVLEKVEANNTNGIFKNAAIVVTLKYLSNFWR